VSPALAYNGLALDRVLGRRDALQRPLRARRGPLARPRRAGRLPEPSPRQGRLDRELPGQFVAPRGLL